MTTQKEWISTNQALNELDIKSRTSLWKFTKKHNIRVSKPSGRVYYSLPDIMQVLKNKAVIMGL
jgi:hypothetical protein